MDINGEEVLVRRDEVAGYVNDPTFLYILQVYNMTKLWGLPHGGGWADEPADIMNGLTAIELEARAIEYEEIKNGSNSTSNSPSKGSRGNTDQSGISKLKKKHNG